MSQKKLKSKLIELFTRFIVPYDEQDQIYCNGADNLYPERIERVIDNSVTAKLASEKLHTFIYGQGFDESLSDYVINTVTNKTLGYNHNKICRDISRHKGAFIHINYDIQGIPNYLNVLPYKNYRISKEDDLGSEGYVWHSKNWKTQTVFTRTGDGKDWYYPYNPNIDVINEQRNNDTPKGDVKAMLKGYRGQVLFVNLEPSSIYPSSWIDPAYYDADTEYHISLFRNDRIKTGFMGANVVLMAEDQDEGEGIVTDEELKGLLGSQNSSNILKVEVKLNEGQNLDDVFKIETVKSEVNTEQFQYDEKIIQENILNSFKNIPKVLVKSSDGALFGASGETLRLSQRIYQEETESIRVSIDKVFNQIFEKHTELKDFETIPLYEDELKEESEEEIEDDNEQDNN